MIKRYLLLALFSCCAYTANLQSHCQMPCGIYHDDMVYDQIDQYVETMYKAVSVLSDSSFKSLHDKNEFIRWIYQKDAQSDTTAELLLTYFLQQKIKPGEPDTAKRLESAHKLLFLLVAIKQNVDKKFVEQFNEEWEKFKLMFHIEGYECKIEMLKMKEREKKEAVQGGGDHDHTH